MACGTHNLFIDINGDVFGCGDNSNGQIGLGQQFNGIDSQHVMGSGSVTYIDKPIKLPEFSKFKAIQVAVGSKHSLILTSDGTVWSFGGAQAGKNGVQWLGHGENNNQHAKYRPQPIKALKHIPIVNISAGQRHNCAISKYGTIYNWGDNRSGQCAFDNKKKEYEYIYTPTKVDIGQHVAFKVECGTDFNILWTKKGALLSWGNNDKGQLGHGDELNSVIFEPKIIQALSSDRVIDIAVGSGGSWPRKGDHCLCLTVGSDGNQCLYTWGIGSQGQLGHGITGNIRDKFTSRFNEYAPRKLQVDFLDDHDKIVSIAAGSCNSALITQNGDLFMFGCGESGQLGDQGKYKKPPNIDKANYKKEEDYFKQKGKSNKKRAKVLKDHYTPIKVTGPTLNCRVTAVSLGNTHSVVIGIPRNGGSSDDEKKNEKMEEKNEDFTIYLEPNQQKEIKGNLSGKVVNVSIKNEKLLFHSRWNLLSRRFGDEDYVSSLIDIEKAKQELHDSKMDKVKKDQNMDKAKKDANKNNNSSLQNADDDDEEKKK
eukprot:791010_1